MSVTRGTSGFGTLLKRGDGGVGAGTKASKTFGSANQMLKIFAKRAGVYGNFLTAGVVVAGVSTSFSIVVTSTSVLINAATDGSSLSISTVDHVIAALYANATFNQYFDATAGTGNGTGVIVAGSADVLAGGAAGAEVFTTIAEVTNLSGPTETLELIEATHMESPGARKEYIPSLLDSGEMTFDLNFLPGDANQNALRDDMNARAKTNYQLVWTDLASTTYAFAGYVTNHGKTSQINDKLSAAVTVKITGDITVTPTPA